MTLALADRARETTTTTGTGTISLGGAATGYQTLKNTVGTGNQLWYVISGQGTAEWEVGIGTVTTGSPDTLSRSTVFSSSNANALVNFSSGTKDVFCSYPSIAHPIINAAGDMFYGSAASTMATLPQPGDTQNHMLISSQGPPVWVKIGGNVATSNQSTFNSSQTNIVGCNFWTGIGENWIFEFLVSLRATAGTTGCGFNLTVPTSATGAFTATGNTSGVTATTSIYTTSITVNTAKSFCAVSGTDCQVRIFGFITGATVGGLVRLQGQSGAVGTTIQINAGSGCFASRAF